MRMDDFTHRAQQLLADAQQQAVDNSNQEIYPAHLLGAMLGEDDGIVRPLLEKSDIDLQKLQNECQDIIAGLPRVYDDGGRVYMSSKMNAVMQKARSESGEMGDDYISSEHLLLGPGRQ